MSDNMTGKQRSTTMSKIRSFNTNPELKLKPLMKAFGFGYHPIGIYGRPDFANRKMKIAVFIDGCFWHKCPIHYIKPKTSLDYWVSKVQTNIKRDERVDKTLKIQGWKIIRIWSIK